MVKAISLLPLALILSACASSPPVVTKPQAVLVEREKLVSLPPDLLAPCQNKPPSLAEGTTNGDLLWAYVGLSNSYIPCLEERLESIRRLQPK